MYIQVQIMQNHLKVEGETTHTDHGGHKKKENCSTDDDDVTVVKYIKQQQNKGIHLLFFP